MCGLTRQGLKVIPCDQVFLIDWSLVPWVFNAICMDLGCPHIDYFTMRTNSMLPFFVCSIEDIMVWKEATFQLNWDDFSVMPSPI